MKAPFNLATGAVLQAAIGDVGHQLRQLSRLEGGHVLLGGLLEHLANRGTGIGIEQAVIHAVV
ncbi:hypothetical protein D3C77_748320 [compost metagenome]